MTIVSLPVEKVLLDLFVMKEIVCVFFIACVESEIINLSPSAACLDLKYFKLEVAFDISRL